MSVSYDVRGRVEDIVLKRATNELRKLEHTYDAVDNITEIVETRGSAVTKTFGYDDIDQLISEDWSTGYTADYEYDENGNRTKRTVASTVEDYFYDDGDKLTEIKIGGSVTKSYDYDMSGRRTEMTDGGGTTYYAYDLGDRLTSITRSGLTTNSFGYNGFDTRVSKTDSTGTTSYKRAGAGVTSSLLRTTVSSTTVDYTPGISAKTSGVTDPSFMYSGLKSTDYQTAGGSTSTRDYDAYGKEIATSGAWVGPLKYGGAYGYQTDPDHGLKLLGHRYYEADTGRFLTRDPVKDGRNWYGYAESSPTRYSDPDGLQNVTIAGDTTGDAAFGWGLPDYWGSVNGVTDTEFYQIGLENSGMTLWGHGAPGSPSIGATNNMTIEKVYELARRRKAKGLPKLDFISIDQCFVLKDNSFLIACLELANEVRGYIGWTIVPTTGQMGKKRIYRTLRDVYADDHLVASGSPSGVGKKHNEGKPKRIRKDRSK